MPFPRINALRTLGATLAAAVVAIPLAQAQAREGAPIDVDAWKSCLSGGGAMRDCARTVGVESFCSNPAMVRVYGGLENCREMYVKLFDAAVNLGASLGCPGEQEQSAGVVIKGQ
jgi:hypothetical protein